MPIQKDVIENYTEEHRIYPDGPSSIPVAKKDENGNPYQSVTKTYKKILTSYTCDNCFNTKGIRTEISTDLQKKQGNNLCNICGTAVDLGNQVYPTTQIIINE